VPQFGDPGFLTPHQAQLRSAEAKNRKRAVLDRVYELLEKDDIIYEDVAQAFIEGLREKNPTLWSQLLDRQSGPIKQLHDHFGHRVPDTQITITPPSTKPVAPLPFDERQQAPEGLLPPKENQNGDQD
jgi:hypothetical protein